MSGPTVVDARSIPVETRLSTILQLLQAMRDGESLVLIAPHAPDQLLQKLIEEFPLRYDFSPLERGPGVWRYEIVARENPQARTVTDYLGWDHDRLDGMLERALGHAREGDWSSVRVLLEDFRHGLFRHIEIEEGILFPAFEEATGMFERGPTMVMRHEHLDIKVAVDGMVCGAKDGDLDEVTRCRTVLLGVLSDHNAKEEQILYPQTDRMLDERALGELVVKLLVG